MNEGLILNCKEVLTFLKGSNLFYICMFKAIALILCLYLRTYFTFFIIPSLNTISLCFFIKCNKARYYFSMDISFSTTMYIPRNRSHLLPFMALEDYSLPLPLRISSVVRSAKYHSIVMGNKLPT